jgi:hypothetical protein
MTGSKTKSTRRAFFVSGGAVVGAGVATAVGASALTADKPLPMEEQLKQLRVRLAGLEDREAIRQLHLAFTTLVEERSYNAAAELFDDHAQVQLSGANAAGKSEIRQLFADQYHSAYRQRTSQQRDEVKLAANHLSATATFHVEVELCTPLQGDCTAAQMARLQGNVADRRWEHGRFDASYIKTQGQWKVASLSYRAA